MLQTLSKMYVQDIMDITKESYPGLGKLLTKVSSDDGHISMNMLMRLAHKWPVHKIFVTLRDPMAVFGIGAIRVAKFTPQVADEDQGRDKYKKTERSTYGEPVAVTQCGVISPRS